MAATTTAGVTCLELAGVLSATNAISITTSRDTDGVYCSFQTITSCDCWRRRQCNWDFTEPIFVLVVFLLVQVAISDLVKARGDITYSSCCREKI